MDSMIDRKGFEEKTGGLNSGESYQFFEIFQNLQQKTSFYQLSEVER